MKYVMQIIISIGLFSSFAQAAQENKKILQAAHEGRLEEIFSGRLTAGDDYQIKHYAVDLTPSPDEKGFTREYFEIDSKYKLTYENAKKICL